MSKTIRTTTYQKAMDRRSRLLTAEHDHRVNDEAALANALIAETPGMTRDEALRIAARMLARSKRR